MLAVRHYYSLVLTSASLLCASVAVAQQQPPSGAVRSHYAPPSPIVTAPNPPAYAPAQRATQLNPPNPLAPNTVAPATHQANLQEPAPFPPHAAAPAPIPLSPRGASSGKALLRTPATGWGAISSVGASLGLVLGAFLCVAWLSKRYLPKSAGPLPKEVVEQLGWAPLAGRQQMQLVRLGNKLLLIAVTPGSGAEPLGEVTDEAEVERLSAMCRRTKPDSSTHSFREVISELERQPARGFVEPTARGYAEPTARGYAEPTARGYAEPTARGFVEPQARAVRPATPSPVSTTAQPRPTVARPLHG